jgi:hypothetical protein
MTNYTFTLHVEDGLGREDSKPLSMNVLDIEARRYWSIKAINPVADALIAYSELQFLDASGADLTDMSGVTYHATSYYGGGMEPSVAFDGIDTIGNEHVSNGTLPHRVWVDFGSPVSISKIKVMRQNHPVGTQRSPYNFVIEYSDDGATWVTSATYSFQTGWRENVYRDYKTSAQNTFDAAAKGANITLSNGNLDAAKTAGGGYQTVLASKGVSTGKWQFEMETVVFDSGTSGPVIGIADKSNLSSVLASYLGDNSGSVEAIGLRGDGTLYRCLSGGAGTGTVTGLIGGGVGTHFTLAVDLDSSPPTLKIYRDNGLVTTINLPTGKTWFPAASVDAGNVQRIRHTGLLFPQAGYTDWD